ncbi:hypothetical protein [Sandaracinus amylolyticus]|uniref:AlkZ-related protein n=1 Tax=Sandaracinus amylolyticus TaxID=927083 RepID=UPI001F311A07|nr:hypothetical protein [Sandaracinus amylolyticus]UJR82390.1 Hypothetical protein I5071_44550 [Sandaracinus amylolyticus]
MARAPTFASAIAAIDRAGALLVYPIENRLEPPSLWHRFHPGETMRWDWDESGDERVVAMWRLRERLARSRRVVYSKWFRNRATLFSRALFTAMLCELRATGRIREGLEPDAIDVLTALESDSPLGAKQLRGAAGLTGRAFESAYQRALRELFARMLIVGFGEIDEGAFPSLAIGATRTLFEDLWDEAGAMDPMEASRTVAALLPQGSAFAKHHAKILASVRG